QSARQAVSPAADEAALDYWQEQLASGPTRIELPADFPRASRGAVEAAGLSAALLPALVARLHELSRAHHVAREALLLTAFAALLARYAQQEDLVVLVRAESGPDCLVSTLLPVAIAVSRDHEFGALLGPTQEALLAGRTRGLLPLPTVAAR